MRPRARTTSLSTELLVQLAVLTATALLLAFIGAEALVLLGVSRLGTYVAALVVADVLVLVGFAGFQLRRLVLRPLRSTAETAEAIAAGDLARRLPDEGPREFRQLAASVNLMTERLLEERAQLVRVEKLASVGRLAAGVAHEIGNPLGAIGGYAHLLRSRAAGAGVGELLDGLDREAARIDRIVRGLLDYARPRQAGAAPVDVNDAVNGAVELLTTQGVLKRIDVSVQLAGDRLAIDGDRHELEQVFVNLLLNAVDAMPAGGQLSVLTERTTREALLRPSVRRRLAPGQVPTPHAPAPRAATWLATTAAHDVVKVVVSDSGVGVPVELQERIFDPFFTTKEPGKGTGLGLAIVARIADNLGGAIWVTRAREGGAAFHLLLPLVPAPALDRVTPTRDRAITPATPAAVPTTHSSGT